jgi:hypothetical protein
MRTKVHQLKLAQPHLASTKCSGQLPKNKDGKLKKRKINMKKILLLLTAVLGLANEREGWDAR